MPGMCLLLRVLALRQYELTPEAAFYPAGFSRQAF
jgi:hypothetical protein